MTKDESKIFAEKYYALYENLSKYNIILPQEKYNEIHKYYHYTSIKIFHNIVDNYEFWAHNIRFSNDYMEEKIVSERFLKEKNYIGDNYLICLCTDGDLLSQWRGYCPDGGVSIELSLPEKEINFTVLKENERYIKNIYSSPLPVSYIQKGNNGLIQVEIKDKLDYLPLIKSYYFHEEKEYRILFNNNDHSLDKCIFEREIGNSTRVPYIKVKFNKIINEKSIKRKFNLVNQKYDKLLKISKNKFGKHFLTIPENKLQEKIFNDISAKLDEYYKIHQIPPGAKRDRITILCDGKPPITGIRIAPMYDHERVREQIEHFCKSRYWLRNVSVECSEIPYTYSLGKK